MKILIRGIKGTNSITCIDIKNELGSLNTNKPFTFRNLLEHIFKNKESLLSEQYCFSRDGKNIPLDQIIPNSNLIYQLESLKLGGKGGFGSLLKGQPPVKKRTNNFESMRDLTGRRMRHVNQERMLKEWHQKKVEEEKMIETYNNPQKEENIKDYIDSDKRKEIHKLNKKFILDTYETTESITDSIKFLMKKQMRNSNSLIPSGKKNINQISKNNINTKEELSKFLNSMNSNQPVVASLKEKTNKKTKTSTKNKKNINDTEINIDRKLEEEVFSLDF